MRPTSEGDSFTLLPPTMMDLADETEKEITPVEKDEEAEKDEQEEKEEGEEEDEEEEKEEREEKEEEEEREEEREEEEKEEKEEKEKEEKEEKEEGEEEDHLSRKKGDGEGEVESAGIFNLLKIDGLLTFNLVGNSSLITHLGIICLWHLFYARA